MKKDVIISIRSCPRYDGDEAPDNIELITDGKFFRKNGIYYIIYKESELTGLDGVTTTLKVEKQRVTLIRNGSYASQMVFECGEKHVGLYHVDGHTMTMSVNAQEIVNELTDDGGDLKVDYAIEINNSLAGENMFHATVREASVSETDAGKDAVI